MFLDVKRQEELQFSLGGKIKLKHPISLRRLNCHLICFHKKAEVDLSNQHLSELILWGRRFSISFELGRSLPESIWFCLFPSWVAVNRLHCKERKKSSLYDFFFFFFGGCRFLQQYFLTFYDDGREWSVSPFLWKSLHAFDIFPVELFFLK